MLTFWTWLAAAAAPLDPAAFTALDVLLDHRGPLVIDTDGPTIAFGGSVRYTGVVAGDVAVFTFGEVVLGGPVEIVGRRPLALLSQGDLTVSTVLDVSARGVVPGPGGYPGGADPAGEAGGGPGGGLPSEGLASGASGGGFGGAGGAAEWRASGGPANGDLLVQLEGGSGGGKCDATSVPVIGSWENGSGGGGGGALELGARGRLVIAAGAEIRADGGAGADDAEHGGGGGAGGGILLHGYNGACEGSLFARGGAGGNDGGALFSEGGGGGGGRVVLLDLPEACAVDVSGGRSGAGGDGASGVRVFREWADRDDDGDGWTVDDGDCDDSDDSVYPGAPEIPGDGIDQDCDGADTPLPPDTGDTSDTGAPTPTEPTGDTGLPGTAPIPGEPTDTGEGPSPVSPEPADPNADEDLRAGGNCGCASASPGGLWLGLFGLLGLSRRRQ